MRILANLNVAGTLDIDTVANAGADTDRFLVQDSNGVIKYRTGTELKSDIEITPFSRIATSFTATAGQTTFTVSYTPLIVDVFYNGARLSASEYTATNGTTIILNTPCIAGDIIDVIAYQGELIGSSVVDGTGVQNEITYWNTTSQISSLSTSIYPNLTELSYVKGVTSSIQSQLNGKQAVFGNQNANIVYAGPTNGAAAAPTFRALVNADFPNSGVTAGTYNDSATQVRPFTVDAKGLITGISAGVTITPAWSSITSTPTTIAGYGITDAYTKTEVDSFLQGLDPKASVKAATTGPITLSGEQTIDSVSIVAGDRVLVKDQSPQTTNGIYVASASGWSRAADMNDASEFPGAYVFVEQGTANADKGFVCTNDSVSLGSTAITFVQFSGNGAYQSVLNGTGFVRMAGTTLSYVTGTASEIIAADGSKITAGTNITISGGVISASDTGFANPMTTLGDIIYGGASGVATRLAGNTNAAKRFLTQTGNGTISAAPSWGTISSSDVSFGNQTANTIFAGPASGAAAAPTFRTLVSADIPNNAANTTGSAATLTTGRTLTIGATGKTFDGSADRTWTLAEIGAQAALTNPVTGTGTTGQIAIWGASGITGSATFTYGATSALLVNNSVTAASAIARGINLTPTLVAAANNDVLVGLDIAPTFTNGSFTGVSNIALRVTGNATVTGTITGTLSGNASTATALATGRTLTIGATGKTFDGTTDRTWTLAEIGAQAAFGNQNPNTVYAGPASGSTAGAPTFRGLVSADIPNNAANTSGNAGTATKLATQRAINGVDFDGSAAITITANTPTSLTFNDGGAGAASGTTFNGGTARTISYNTIGAPKADGTGASGFWPISIDGTVSRTVAAGSDHNFLYGAIGTNDFFRVRAGGAANAGYLEIATADDGTEPIYVRQYTGLFATVARTLTLLDGSGNTSFPGTITASNFSGSSSGTNTGDQTNISGTAAGENLGTVTNRSNSTSQNIVFSNGRKGLVGVYDAAQTQAIFAMGSSYVLTDGGASNTIGPLYGLAWSYNPDYGGAGNNPQSKAGLNHQLLLMQNGVTTAAMGSGIWTSGALKLGYQTDNWELYHYSDNTLRFNYNGAGADEFTLTTGGNVTFRGTINASNFSGSSSGTNTGDQTNISGTASGLTSSNYITQRGSTGSWNADFQNTPAGATAYGGDVGANTVNGPGGTWWMQQNFRHTNGSNYWGVQVAWGWEDNANRLKTRNVTSNNFGAWIDYLNTDNFPAYGVTLSGSQMIYGQKIFNAVTGKPLIQGNTDGWMAFTNTNGNAEWDFSPWGTLGSYSFNINESDVANRFKLYSGGGCDISGAVSASGGFFDTSDIRFKNVIETNPSVNLDSIDVIKFTFKDDEKHNQVRYGYSAQQIQSIMPELIFKHEDGDRMHINYSDIHTIKIKALEERVKELEAKLGI